MSRTSVSSVKRTICRPASAPVRRPTRTSAAAHSPLACRSRHARYLQGNVGGGFVFHVPHRRQPAPGQNPLQQALSIELPVYLWVTKVDLLAGFNEFFGGYSREQRNQVWGFTFPYSEKSKSNRPTPALFADEWAALEKTLFSVQDAHLAQEMDQRRRNYIYAFPQQFAGLRARVAKAVDFVFAESRIMHQPLLRGVYFSSGTQEGTVFDRVLGSLRKAFSSAGFSFALLQASCTLSIPMVIPRLGFAFAHTFGSVQSSPSSAP